MSVAMEVTRLPRVDVCIQEILVLSMREIAMAVEDVQQMRLDLV
jgi:hypothetical protein